MDLLVVAVPGDRGGGLVAVVVAALAIAHVLATCVELSTADVRGTHAE